MIAFTEAQIIFITELLKKVGVDNGTEVFEEFNRTYKKPVKKRQQLEDGVRCVAVVKHKGRCNGRRIGSETLCGIHKSRGTPYGTVEQCTAQFEKFSIASPPTFNEQETTGAYMCPGLSGFVYEDPDNVPEDKIDDLLKLFFA